MNVINFKEFKQKKPGVFPAADNEKDDRLLKATWKLHQASLKQGIQARRFLRITSDLAEKSSG